MAREQEGGGLSRPDAECGLLDGNDTTLVACERSISMEGRIFLLLASLSLLLGTACSQESSTPGTARSSSTDVPRPPRSVSETPTTTQAPIERPSTGEDCSRYATEMDRMQCNERKRTWQERGEKAREITDRAKERVDSVREKVKDRVADFVQGFGKKR